MLSANAGGNKVVIMYFCCPIALLYYINKKK